MTAIPIPEPANLLLFERTTRTGRHLIYRLEILQQPEQARACGSGSKSHSDRRPIDPPPVVSLRIFEGYASGDPATSSAVQDITFHYNANLFLFVTLEHARPMAHGRVANPVSQMPPVLTGMPISGMAFLDRPIEAGYFLFPDLSVRHEGLCRLAFNLYEQIKDENDLDVLSPGSISTVPSSPSVSTVSTPRQITSPSLTSVSASSALLGAAPDLPFEWRMEIKSHSFKVYSAKKFPGLAESTHLSRTVAEQGCRIRIRRDVRMRRRRKRRDNVDSLPRLTPTPENLQARSSSSGSDHCPVLPRQPLVHDFPPPPAHFTSDSSSHGLESVPPCSPQQYSSQPQYQQLPPESPITSRCPSRQQAPQLQQRQPQHPPLQRPHTPQPPHHQQYGDQCQQQPQPHQPQQHYQQPQHYCNSTQPSQHHQTQYISGHSTLLPYYRDQQQQHYHANHQVPSRVSYKHHKVTPPPPSRESTSNYTPSYAHGPAAQPPVRRSVANFHVERRYGAPQFLRAESPPPEPQPPLTAETHRTVLPPLSTITNDLPHPTSHDIHMEGNTIEAGDTGSATQPPCSSAKRAYASTLGTCDPSFPHSRYPTSHRPDTTPAGPVAKLPRRFPDLLSHVPSGLDRRMISRSYKESNSLSDTKLRPLQL